MAGKKKHYSSEIRAIAAKELRQMRAEVRFAVAAAMHGNCAAAAAALQKARMAGGYKRKAFPALRRAHIKVRGFCPKSPLFSK